MGFGTGHHATTRLCLAALQALDLTALTCSTSAPDRACWRSRRCASAPHARVGIDNDPDADSVGARQPRAESRARHVVFETADLATTRAADADVVTANLTGALLVRSARVLIGGR